MSPERVQKLVASRASISKQREELAALPAAAERDQALRQLDGLMAQIDGLIRPRPVKVSKPRVRRAAPSFEQIAEIARFRKDATTEIRVSVEAWNERRAVNVRQWFLKRDGQEWRPTGKGVFLSAPLAKALVEALQQAQQHLQQP